LSNKIKKIKTALFDIESNGLLASARKGEPMDRIHCIAMRSHETKETFRFRNNIDTIQTYHYMIQDRLNEKVFIEHKGKFVEHLERDEGTYMVNIDTDENGDNFRQNKIDFLPNPGFEGSVRKVKCAHINEQDGVIKNFKFKPSFICNDLAEGVEMLTEAEFVVGHNIVSFDLNAVDLIFPGFLDGMKGKVRDTLVMARMCFADQKIRDFKLNKQGKLPGFLIGTHSLDSWGWRLGLHKGDYTKDCKALGIDPWANWNLPQEDYCENDVDVTEVLWDAILKAEWSDTSTVLEHQIHELMGRVEQNGIPLDINKAETLVGTMQKEVDDLRVEVNKSFEDWWVPAKKWIVKPQWNNPVANVKKYKQPREEFGEDRSRAVWGDVINPKKDLNFKDPMRANRMAGAPFCPVALKKFNTNSRQNIIDRYTMMYGWVPEDFTDTGQPSVSAEVLEKLDGVYPWATELSEIFFLNKRIGTIKTGDKSWLNHVDEEGMLHTYYNVGGTVTGRASHNNPNIGQVVKVKRGKEGEILYGRKGRFGYEMRDCFYAPDGWVMMGVDQSGIEARCLANLTQEYDEGHLRDLILDGDIHTYNMEATEWITVRDDAKTELYAMMYGSGDENMGRIVNKTGTTAEKIRIGKSIRADIMEGLPGLKKADRYIQKLAKRGYLEGLDGRKIFIRKAFAALNARLQSDGALIAKKWAVLFEHYMLDEGYVHGWDGDFAIVAWVHDEIQTCVRPEIQERALELCIKAALDAGKFFDFGIPVDAEGQFGKTWAETH